ncbi:GntR family transcriptional regulator [Rhodococcus wratislaviensis]|uniref:GntR family transcriptional regulator n=1 Tax=Rhodococcus wratislaviensis TaxID=44752 RepID=UPI0004AF1996|nr:GntR family transcriptional regulator [Rhodococcus wratislaviensis]
MHVNAIARAYDEVVHTEVAGQPPRVDRDDARPLHVQIFDILHQQISSHALPPGSALPTEDELQQQFGVSRSVVRQALASLADRGLIHRQRGRGSVVAAAPVLRRSVQRAGGLSEQAVAQGQQLRTHVVSVQPSAPPDAALDELGTGRAWQIERVRYLDDVPVAYMRTWVPRELFPHFTEELLEGNSLLALMRAHGYTPAGGPRHVQAVAADPNLAYSLEVETGDPLLLLEGVTRDTSGQGLEWFSVWHRANTVFDVDAQVATTPAAISPEQVTRLRSMARELDAALAEIDGTR